MGNNKVSFEGFFDLIYSYEYIQELEPLTKKTSDSDLIKFIKKEFPFYKKLTDNIELSCIEIFKNEDKKYKKLLVDLKQDLNALSITKKASILSMASKLLKLGVNKELVFNQILASYEKDLILFNQSTPFFINRLLKTYGDKRTIQLFFDVDTKKWEQEIKMGISELSEAGEPTDQLEKKPKSLRSIHDYILRQLDKIELDNIQYQQEDAPLKPREDLLVLNGQTIVVEDNKYLVKIAQTRYDLCNFSLRSVFDNCVGKFSEYFDRGSSGFATYIGIFTPDQKPLYCIEATKYSFIQAKGVSNSEIPYGVRKSLEAILTLVPEVPKDFTPIKHHFIFGYKYNSITSSLFLMFSKNMSIYEYEGVDAQTYEEFVAEDKKGAFLNSVLKRGSKYRCQKVS